MRRRHQYFVYILTNPGHTVLYTGMSNSLHRRMVEHRSGEGSKFCKRYNVTKLVYYEAYPYVNDAIAREKQIKAGSRHKKLDLINELNPAWEDLAADLEEW